MILTETDTRLTFACRCAEEFRSLLCVPLCSLLTALVISRRPLHFRAIHNYGLWT